MDTFRSGGKGGQNQNKRDTGVRFTHLESGAVGESREARTQEENKRLAWRRMAESKKFKLWLHKQLYQAQLDDAEIDRKVAEQMQDENLLIEYYDPNN